MTHTPINPRTHALPLVEWPACYLEQADDYLRDHPELGITLCQPFDGRRALNLETCPPWLKTIATAFTISFVLRVLERCDLAAMLRMV